MNSKDRTTKVLLGCGIAAGPLYLTLGLLQVLVREGFDITRHSLSLMSIGDLGWIQIVNFLIAGVLIIAGAVGMRKALQGNLGGTWGPILLGLYGVSLIGAGIFVADPMNGFPPGSTDTNTVSTRGLLHLASGSVGFIGLIAACFVFARRFYLLKQPGWANYSLATGLIFLVAFVGIATGSQADGAILSIVTLSFWAAVVLIWVWVTLLLARVEK